MAQKTSYPFLPRFTDPAAQQGYKYICDRLTDLEQRITALEASALQPSDGVMDAANVKISNLGDATADQDAVTFHQLKEQIYQIKKATT